MCFPKASRVIACAVPFISLSPHWTNAIVSGSFLQHFISEATDDGTDRSPYFSSAACHFHLPLPVTNWNVSACSDPIIHNDFSAIARCSVSYISLLGLIFSLFTDTVGVFSIENVSFCSFTDTQHSQQDQGTEKSQKFFCKLYTMWCMHPILCLPESDYIQFYNYQYETEQFSAFL